MIDTSKYSFFELLKNELNEVNAYLLNQKFTDFNSLNEKLLYPFSTKGKRIRAALTILSGKMVSNEKTFLGFGNDLIYAAASVEVMHHASLIHDDILDNSDTRRNKPTVHKMWGKETAIIIGDYLAAHSFDIANQIDNKGVFIVLSTALKRLSLGEAEELFYRDYTPMSTKQAYYQYLNIIENKTASLIAASCEIGSLVAGGSSEENALFYNFGLNIGKAYQIIDDVLDIIGSSSLLGKNINSDSKECILTLPFIYASEDLNYSLATICSEMKYGTGVNAIIELIKDSNIIQKCYEEAQSFFNEGLKHLESFPRSAYKEAIEELANYSIIRSY